MSNVILQQIAEYNEILKAEKQALLDENLKLTKQLQTSTTVVDVKEYLTEIEKLKQEIEKLRS